MSQFNSRPFFVLLLGSAAAVAIPAALSFGCNVGWWEVAILPGFSAAAALALARDCYAEGRPGRAALAVGRLGAKLALGAVLLLPIWGIGVGDLMAARVSAGRSSATAAVRTLLQAELALKDARGAFVELECLASGLRCLDAGTGAGVDRSFLAAERAGYRFAFRGVAAQGEGAGRLSGFAYWGVPLVPRSVCPLRATGDSLICADSTGRLCWSSSIVEVTGTRCPESCIDIGDRPSRAVSPAASPR